MPEEIPEVAEEKIEEGNEFDESDEEDETEQNTDEMYKAWHDSAYESTEEYEFEESISNLDLSKLIFGETEVDGDE